MTDSLNKVLRIGQLYDFYNALLTDKQQQCLNMHYLQDFSLAEIAEEFGVSRQAVHDILRRAELMLEEYEEKLGLVSRYRKERLIIDEIYKMVSNFPEPARKLPEINLVLEKLQYLLDDAREV
ncbi:MAG TPA: YlxM family DNA-binding protein [Methylomusa anaerophila]|uniref:UPF0122 protein MAMMFC1_03930 n=1 Tax=Methylomusa anaerophila TaxID=1930071 RepID=A0A348AQ73_9FIRM|nr:YlxM family DNA-binding protein [Methylomusa anaerophila]BBB93221.1 putative DNA-binding protein [Methylomusa anaerophila]HML86947.1 YlxM family DNA-binding protein [Methylomusa anaerophila]